MYKDFQNNSYHTFSFQVTLVSSVWDFFHKSNKIYLQRLTYLKQWIECCEKIVLVRNERRIPVIKQTRIPAIIMHSEMNDIFSETNNN